MSGSLLSIAQTGLAAANLGLATTSHNIANVNTPGYSRQQIVQTAALAGFSGAGFSGKGVNVTNIQRVASDFLTTQAHLATADSAASSTALDYLNRIADNMTSDETSLSSSVDGFFSSLQDLSASPSGTTERQSVISAAQSLVNRFQTLDSQLTSMSSEIGTRLQTAASQINSYATEIGKLNEQIALQTGSGLTPNDLLDQRDQLIRNLSELTRVSTVAQPDGRVNVFLASGDALVLAGQSIKLVVQRDTSDPDQFRLAAQGASTGNVARTIQGSIDLGGTIGGLMSVQSDIADARNELGRIAVAFGDAINKQQALGQDLKGVQGTNLFTLASPKAFALDGSTGSINVSYADTTALQASDYQLDYDGTQYTLTRQSDGVKTNFATLPQTIDGLTIGVGTAPAAGDTFIIQPTREGAANLALAFTDPDKIAAAALSAPSNSTGDNTNVRAMAALANTALVNGKTIADANSQLMGRIGNAASSKDIEATANERLLTQVTTQEQSVSGVNLDEEAANLLRYQQSYQAAAKAIAIAGEVFNAILDIMG